MIIDKRLLLKFSLGFFIIIVISFALCFVLQPSANDFLSFVGDRNLGVVDIDSKNQDFIRYLINNGFKVPFQMLYLAVIPIPLIYFFPMILTAAVTGVILYLPFTADLQGHLSLLDILIGIIPHMLIEVSGFLIVACGTYHLNRYIRSKLFKRISSDLKFSDCLLYLFKSYILIALPMFIVAAAIEAYITPLLG